MSANIVTRFHRRHSEKIALSEDNTVAYVKGNFPDDLTVFGEKPLQPTEIFLIEIEQTQPCWNDQLGLTLTTVNPNNLSENSYIGEHNSVTTRKGPLRFHMLKPTKPNVGMSALHRSTRIGILYIPISDKKVKVHHIVNGEHHGAYCRDIPYNKGPLYPKIDIYGNTEKVRIIQLYGVPTLQSACRDTVRQYTTDAAVSSLRLPNLVKEYLLYKTPIE